MTFGRVFVSAAMLVLCLISSPAFAQTKAEAAAAQARNPDPVFVFNRVCYSQVPNVQAIENLATQLAWRLLAKDLLQDFDPEKRAETLLGWQAQVGERLFQIGVTQGPVPAKMRESFPKFANGKATSCSMVLDDQQPASEFLPNMQRLAGKEPIASDVEEGRLRTTTWAGGNDEVKVFLFAKAPPTGNGGLLNVTVLTKK